MLVISIFPADRHAHCSIVDHAAVGNKTSAAAETVLESPANTEHGIEDDFFDKAFQIPSLATRKMCTAKRNRPRPPSVATSEAFKAYHEKMENEKHNQEQLKLQKRKIREERKLAAKKKLEARTEKRKKQQESLKRKPNGTVTKLTEKKRKVEHRN